MKICAVICEYNPMHPGHVLHLRRSRELTGCDFIVCIMSGNFVQRGEPAALDKYIRAEAALKNGADLVIELPALHALSCAERFAGGGVLTAAGIDGVTHLSFGSECGDIAILNRAAAAIGSEDAQFSGELFKNLSSGKSYIRSRLAALPDDEVRKTLASPNNVLACEYIRALRRTDSKIIPVTILREGMGYNEQDGAGLYPSAAFIRKLLRTGDRAGAAGALGVSLSEYLDRCIDLTGAEERLFIAAAHAICAEDTGYLSGIYDVSERMEYRIKRKAAEALSYDDLISGVTCARYTRARVRRILTAIVLRIKQAEADSLKDTVVSNVLGFKEGSGMLIKRLANPVSRAADLTSIDNNARQLMAITERADDLYALLCGLPRRGSFYRPLVKIG